MKPIRNQRLFDRLNPALYMRCGETLHYRTEAIGKSHCVANARPAAGGMFTALLRYHETMLINNHHRRIRQNCMAVESIISGSLYFRQDGRAYLLEKGDVFIMRKGADTEFLCGPEGFCEKSSLVIDGRLLDGFMAAGRLGEADVLSGIDQELLERRFDEIAGLMEHPDHGADAAISGRIFSLLEFLNSPDDSPDIPARVRRMAEFLRSEDGTAATLSETARHFGVSERSLCKLFTRYYGVSPHRYRIRARMEKAAEYLEPGSGMTIKEISGRLGYSTQMNFATEFRKFHGCTPREYTRKKVWL